MAHVVLAEAESATWSIQTGFLYIQEIHLSFNHPERNAKRPCWTMWRHESEHTKISWIFHSLSQSIKHKYMSCFIFFILFQLDPSLAPQPECLFFDGTLSIYHYLCSKIAPWRHHSLCIRSAPGSTTWWDLQGGTPQNRPTTHHSTCAAIRTLPRNSNLRSLIAPYDTPDVRCRLFPAFDWGQSISYSSKKNASNVTSIQSEWIWTTYSQTAPHSLERFETPQSWPAKFIHGRLGAYLAKHWEGSLYVLESPGNWWHWKLINQVAKIQNLIIWSYLPFWSFQIFQLISIYKFHLNLSTASLC